MQDLTTFRTVLDPSLVSFLGLYHDTEGHLESVINALARPPSVTSLRVNTLLCSSDSLLKDLSDVLSRYKVERHQCGEAIIRGADIYAPGVLAAVSGIQAEDKVSVYIDVDQQVHKGLRVEFEGRKVFVGNGTTTMSRSAFYKSTGVAVRMTEGIYRSPPLNGIFPEKCYLQNIPSMITAHYLEAREGDRIIDMCASPGGKTSHIAQLMRNNGTIFSFDRNENKVEVIRQLCQRLAITCVRAFAMDSTKLLEGEEQQKWREEFDIRPESFDRILLDPPCSGLGQRPRMRESMNLVDLFSYAPYQRKLFHTAIRLLKVGGVLVYSTCTLNPQENEEVVRYALDHFPVKLVGGPQHLSSLGSKGLTWRVKSEGEIEEIMKSTRDEHIPAPHGSQKKRKQKQVKIVMSESLKEEEAELVRRFDPSKDDGIGFFIAKFVKIADMR
ncbi:putative methyltransferase NSUN6-like [Planoprotostelium fungivorum]|uniref:Putative methyltransferase NSUN6-like n=1 Tax=Planoprotostelium fungivorum TaxID=1890364 RepID=A0A2P6MYW6_9EUKA|nr:putative methyltransferase NSUN6-like [Planoprotostelium fungivorum]